MRIRAWFATATMMLGLTAPGLAGADVLSLTIHPESGATSPGVPLLDISSTVSCYVDGSASIPSLYVRNTGGSSLPAGTRIMWGAQPGSLSGVALVGPNGLPAGEWQYVGGYVGISDCTASVIN